MKQAMWFLVVIGLIVPQGTAQDAIPPKVVRNVRHIINLIKNNEVTELSTLVSYPLRMARPIPDIDSRETFIRYYQILFDNSFKNDLCSTPLTMIYANQHHGCYGLLNGMIWFEGDGHCNICAINYTSPQAESLMATLSNKIKEKIYPSVKNWKRNIFYSNAGKFLIRVDEMSDKTLRYTSWSSPKTISDKPDLILLGGDLKIEGTLGYRTYTFTNGKYAYQIIVDPIGGEGGKDAGTFLHVLLNGKEASRIRMTNIQ